MKRLISLISLVFPSVLLSTTTISCNWLKVNVHEINNISIEKLLFQNVHLSILEDVNNIPSNNYKLLYWNDLEQNFSHFIFNVYEVNTRILKPQYRSFFSSIGYEDLTQENILHNLKINIVKNIGIPSLGMTFSKIGITQSDNNNIKITFQNIRLYFEFTDPINNIYKEYYFADSNNIIENFKNASIYYPVPNNNLNNESIKDLDKNHDLSKYINSEIQLLFLNNWFDWKQNTGMVSHLLVAGTQFNDLTNINGLVMSKYNIFNLITSNLFGITEITSIDIARNNHIIKTPLNYTLEIGDTLIFNIHFNFLDYNLNFIIPFQIKR